MTMTSDEVATLNAYWANVRDTHNAIVAIAEDMVTVSMVPVSGLPYDACVLVDHYAFGCRVGKCNTGHESPVAIAKRLDAYAGPHADMIYRLLRTMRDNDHAVYPAR